MTLRIIGETIQSPTCLLLPYSLKLKAKAAGINMSQILKEGIEKELQNKGNAQGQNATNTKTLASLSSTDEQADV
jgi:post-segregation antitoxin (ccd killing protein)